ncbi:hypothetical protein LCGC14_1947050, partial [marine sediment metagenome]
YGEKGFGHAFIFIGWEITQGVEYLIAQLSNGKEIGNKGLFYFKKDIVNKEIGKYGAYMFVDINPNSVKATHWNWLQRFYNFLIRLKR